jgi:hypothetical protein
MRHVKRNEGLDLRCLNPTCKHPMKDHEIDSANEAPLLGYRVPGRCRKCKCKRFMGPPAR